MLKPNSRGFTLLEVLIALAIVAIALTALLQSTSQSVYNSKRLVTKTLANRILINTANKIQAKLVTVPYPPYEYRETVSMAREHWTLVAKRFTEDTNTDKITLSVHLVHDPTLAQLTLLQQKP
jgi:general secretion pathway protein I